MDEFWIEKAHQYISTHSAFSTISDILYSEDLKVVEISAVVNVNLPSIYLENGITEIGVRNAEPVRFIFSEHFPLEAPHILLRDDFPRVFPHINPSESDVCPCIYEGSLSELLQQAEWMNGVLNQLVDWLEKAASNSLLNYDQGWEPMRIDSSSGYICFEKYSVLDFFSRSTEGSKKVMYSKSNELFFVDFSADLSKSKSATLCAFTTPAIIDKYTPCPITNIAELYHYAETIGVSNFKERIESYDSENIDDDLLFCILAVKRPVNLIGSEHAIELINFVINKSAPRKKKNKKLKRVLLDCKVQMLHHIDKVSPELLKRISGSTQNNNTRSIAILGCGSLGSKIALHLARNGNQPFLCIDKDVFLPHNNARHGLTFTFSKNKAELLSYSLYSMTGQECEIAEEAVSTDYSKSKIIIDSTASFSVRSFLMGSEIIPPVISAGLYDRGKSGLLFMESKSRKTRLCDLWAHLYLMTLNDSETRQMLFASHNNEISIGQSCSSNTLIMSDAVISLYAASCSLQIQKILEDGFPETGKIFLMKQGDFGNLITEKFDIPDNTVIRSLRPKNWQTRLSSSVEKRMSELSSRKQPNETGGVLLGSVFLNAKTIVITDIIDAPPDSIETRTEFVLGTECLETQIKDIERKTNGKVTYLGTWHSHPFGGGASETDKRTSAKLLFVRNYEPTVCLIWTPTEVVEV